jgi:hypothetical protein
MRVSSAQTFAHTFHTKLCAHLPQKILLTRSTQNFSHTSHKKGSLNPETFCIIQNWHGRTFTIFSLFSLCFTRRATQHRKTITSKDKTDDRIALTVLNLTALLHSSEARFVIFLSYCYETQWNVGILNETQWNVGILNEKPPCLGVKMRILPC